MLGLPEIDLREWGPQLRFSAPRAVIERFYGEVSSRVPPFVVYGSGDFHHLTALWLRRLDAPTVVISFDNHPDWDIRPPKWCCGSWVNRALELSNVRKVSVWGCGNFECWWPAQLFGNRLAERLGRLEVHPWADHRPLRDRQRRGAIVQSSWRERFLELVAALNGAGVYVTIDMDCFRGEEAITSWESGSFTVDDVIWALEQLRPRSEIIAGDICGAFSAPAYARRKQRFASEMDHPKLTRPAADDARRINEATVARLLPVLAQ